MDRDRMASDQASGQEAARSALLRRRVGSSIDSNSQQNLGAGGKDSNSSRYGQESQRTSHERAEPAGSIVFLRFPRRESMPPYSLTSSKSCSLNIRNERSL